MSSETSIPTPFSTMQLTLLSALTSTLLIGSAAFTFGDTPNAYVDPTNCLDHRQAGSVPYPGCPPTDTRGVAKTQSYLVPENPTTYNCVYDTVVCTYVSPGPLVGVYEILGAEGLLAH